MDKLLATSVAIIWVKFATFRVWIPWPFWLDIVRMLARTCLR